MNKILKTNAARLLDAENVSYALIPYEVNESDLSAIHVAQQLGEPVDQLFKTLVLKGNKTGYFVCIIPGNETLDLKKAAKASGNKSCEMILMNDLLSVTGYIRGACSPIGMKKLYRTVIDESCIELETIIVSAGKIGFQVELSPFDLLKIIEGSLAHVIA